MSIGDGIFASWNVIHLGEPNAILAVFSDFLEEDVNVDLTLQLLPKR